MLTERGPQRAALPGASLGNHRFRGMVIRAVGIAGGGAVAAW
ncbi:MAG: hypothetical protein WCA32_14285 [Chromatiaceae bacterium]